MEASAKIEEIKKQKRVKAALLAKKMKEAQESLEKFQEEDGQIYVNGKAAELQEHCVITKTQVKFKEARNDSEK